MAGPRTEGILPSIGPLDCALHQEAGIGFTAGASPCNCDQSARLASGPSNCAKSGISMKSSPSGGSLAAAVAVAAARVTAKSCICLSRNAPSARSGAPTTPGNGHLNSIRLTVAAQFRHRQRTMSAASAASLRPDRLPQANSAPPSWLPVQKTVMVNASATGISAEPWRGASARCGAGGFGR